MPIKGPRKMGNRVFGRFPAESPTWAMVLISILVAATGYGASAGDPPVGSAGASMTTVVLLGLWVWIAKHCREPWVAFGIGAVISITARSLLEPGLVRSLLAGGLWVALTYWLCDLDLEDESLEEE
jgi:hypothetical protein